MVDLNFSLSYNLVKAKKNTSEQRIFLFTQDT